MCEKERVSDVKCFFQFVYMCQHVCENELCVCVCMCLIERFAIGCSLISILCFCDIERKRERKRGREKEMDKERERFVIYESKPASGVHNNFFCYISTFL